MRPRGACLASNPPPPPLPGLPSPHCPAPPHGRGSLASAVVPGAWTLFSLEPRGFAPPNPPPLSVRPVPSRPSVPGGFAKFLRVS